MTRLFLVFALSAAAIAEDAPVSFTREIAPILRRNCQGCHRPGKAKSDLDVTSFAALLKGGKHGAIVKPGAPADSELLEQIIGDEPAMPPEGDPLTVDETAKIERWIAQGAKDDTPPPVEVAPTAPVYRLLPAVSSLAWSPDGALLAVAGTGEVVLHSGDGERIVARLVGTAPRIESLAFSKDGKLLAVCGGAPSEFGEIQLWNVADHKLTRTIRTSRDSVYGVSFSPDASRVAVGCADKLVRAFDVSTGAEVMKCDNHIDWVFATAFAQDGARVISASRDKAVKLIEVSSGRLIDDINRPREPILSLARHPKEDWVAYGSDAGAVRLHRVEPRGGRLAEGDDKENSFIREFERLKGPIHSLSFSADGEMLVVGSAGGEWRIFKTADGKRMLASKEAGAPIYAVGFDPKGRWIGTTGSEGKVRLWEVGKGEPVRAFDAVPLSPGPLANLPQ